MLRAEWEVENVMQASLERRFENWALKDLWEFTKEKQEGCAT